MLHAAIYLIYSKQPDYYSYLTLNELSLCVLLSNLLKNTSKVGNRGLNASKELGK